MSRAVIGLTGGIGSGKSTAAAYFRRMGIPVLDADAISRAALDPGTVCHAKTLALFGDGVKSPDGSLNRRAIAERVFSDESLRQKLNAIIHPYVLSVLRRETERSDASCVIWEVPLLFESGFDAFCTRTLAVLADESVRIRRVTARDGVTREHAAARIAAQITDAERAARATDTVTNNGTEAELFHELDRVLAKWKEVL